MTKDGLDLLTVVMHELGHLLGYGHSDDPDDLMAPVFSADAQLPRHSGMERYERQLDLWFAELGEDS